MYITLKYKITRLNFIYFQLQLAISAVILGYAKLSVKFFLSKEFFFMAKILLQHILIGTCAHHRKQHK